MRRTGETHAAYATRKVNELDVQIVANRVRQAELREALAKLQQR